MRSRPACTCWSTIASRRRSTVTLDILHRQSRSLERIVGDLLDVARITQGKIALDRVVVDLRDIAQRCVQALAEEIKISGHTVDVDLGTAETLVNGDTIRLEQVASNLVTNAIKYTPRGGRIEVRVSTHAGHARFEVADNGVGMTPEVRDHVFDVFVQAKQSIDRSRGGLGLGLTVVRQLVGLHGGSVSAASEGTGKGSRFVVELPLAPVDAAVLAPPVERVTQAGGLHIVLIEDNDDARGALSDALAHFDHTVDVAADGVEGLALVFAKSPDVALVDIGLPRLDGYEIARQVRSRFNGAGPRLIAMTGYGRPEDRERAIEAGFDHHIVKPVSLKNLQGLLAAIPH